MNVSRKRIKSDVPISPKYALAWMMSLSGLFLGAHSVYAMRPDQMNMLAGTALLDLRVDAALKICGLPSVIRDAADTPPLRNTIQWGDVGMKLSSMKWELVYSRQQDTVDHENGWINPDSGSVTCLPDLSGLVLYAKGNAGFLSVKKKHDSMGYVTTYRVPDNLYLAHQVTGLSGNLKQAMPVSTILQQYGNPDEILDAAKGIKHYRYWVVVKQKAMPVSLHAVDFEVKETSNTSIQYSVYTDGTEFVQDKLDALMREWERDYVLD